MRQTLISTEQFSGFLCIGIYRIYQHFPLPCYKSLSSSSHIAKKGERLAREQCGRRLWLEGRRLTPRPRGERKGSLTFTICWANLSKLQKFCKNIFSQEPVWRYIAKACFSGSQWKDPGCMGQWFTSWTKERLRYYLKSITTNPSTANYWAKIYLYFRTLPLWSSCSCSIWIRAI